MDQQQPQIHHTLGARTSMRDWLSSRCPATDNAPVSMTESGWLALCAGTRKYQGKKLRTGTLHGSRCPSCKGEHRPANLTIIKLNGNGEVMTKNPVGECSVCTEKARIRTNFGIEMCATCGTIFSHINNRLSSVAKAVVHLGKADEMISLIAPSMSKDSSVAVNVTDQKTQDIFKRIAAAVRYQGEDAEKLAAIVEALGPEYDNAQGMLNHANEKIVDLEGKLEEIGNERGELLERVKELEAMSAPMIFKTNTEPKQAAVELNQSTGTVPVELYNLALAQIEGKVTGLSANRLRALAKVQ